MNISIPSLKYFIDLQKRLKEEDKKEKEKEKKGKKRYFTVIEDEMLAFLVSLLGENNWKEITKMIPNKTVRQCRERYKTYLKPGINHNKWTKEEDEKLETLVKTMGSKWAMLTKYFPGRTDNALKNRYNVHIRCASHPNNKKDDFVSFETLEQRIVYPTNDYDLSNMSFDLDAWNSDILRGNLFD